MTYTTEARVRREYAFLINEENFTGKTGSVLRLKERAYAIASVSKDGVALTDPADYSFGSPRTLTLVVALTSGVFVDVTYDTNLDPITISDFVTEAVTRINARMVKIFGPDIVTDWASPDTPALIQEIATDWVGCMSIEASTFKNHSFGEKMRMLKESRLKRIEDDLKAIEEGDMELIGETPLGDTQLQVVNSFDTQQAKTDPEIDTSIYFQDPDSVEAND